MGANTTVGGECKKERDRKRERNKNKGRGCGEPSCLFPQLSAGFQQSGKTRSISSSCIQKID